MRVPWAIFGVSLASVGVAVLLRPAAGGASIGCPQAHAFAGSPCIGKVIPGSSTRHHASSSVGAGSSCRTASLEPLKTLGGRVSIVRHLGFSAPRLIIRWRAPELPERCRQSGGHRSIAVSVRLRTSESHGFIPIGLRKGERQWLTFDRCFGARPLTESVAMGFPFDEALGCIRRVIGVARYRFKPARGISAQRFVPYRPHYERCPRE